MNNYQDANAESQQEYFGTSTISYIVPTPNKPISFEASILKQIANSSRAITAKEIKAMIHEASIRGDDSTITLRRSIFNQIDNMISKATLDE